MSEWLLWSQIKALKFDVTDKSIVRGHPSYVWREGQERRLRMVRRWAALEGQRVLDVGCGLGMYSEALGRYTPHVFGVEIELERAREAWLHGRARGVAVAPGEALPFVECSFDVVFNHEVLEHVQDDAQVVGEMVRVCRVGGRIVTFCPNRWYPAETHGCYWRGNYSFGNKPLINYLPDPLRDRLAPHVRAYTGRGLRRLFEAQPVRVVHHGRIYAGYDNVVARWPRLGRLVRRVSYALERTPLQVLGLSHFLVVERVNDATTTA
ncbi:MAG: methyltransferase domain-containing protein [Anaerolineae bacterium]|jgi:SAM-dependent methyltransferase